MGILEKGGNAFDAAVATGLTLQVVEPHLNGPSGEMPAVLYSKKKDKVEVLCGQGPAPAGATIEHYRSKGLTAIPGDGLLATVIPGAWDGWMLLLRDYGRLTLRDILEPAIHYAGQGHPLLPRVSSTIGGLADFFHDHWPTSFETWLPGGICPGAMRISAIQNSRPPGRASCPRPSQNRAAKSRSKPHATPSIVELFYAAFSFRGWVGTAG